MVELPTEFRTTPLAYYVWSRSPRAAHVLAFVIARHVDPAFRWISIRESAGQPSEEESWVHRLMPADRVLDPLSEAEMGQGPRLPKAAFQAMVRPEGAANERIALNHFFLLPPRLQRILDENTPSSSPRTVVVANTNRVRDFYPTDPDRLRAYTEVFPRSGFSMITTSSPPPYNGRYGFDIVLRMDVGLNQGWRAAHLVVEKGLRSGKFRTGTTLPPEEMPWYLEMGATVEKVLG